MNTLAAQLLLDLTWFISFCNFLLSKSSMRFEGTLNVDLNEITMNLVPYPRMHFLLSSLSGSAVQVQSHAPARKWALVSSHFFSLFQVFPNYFLMPLRAIINLLPLIQNSICLFQVFLLRYTIRYLACALLLRGDVDMQDIRKNISKQP